MVIDKLSEWRKYATTPRLAFAFELLSKPEAVDLADGRYELDGDSIIALPQSYTTKPSSDGKLEAHRRYIDIQYVLSGCERMGWARLDGLKGVFDEEKDLGFYEGEAEFLTVPAGYFTIFYPHDAHMPCINPTEGPCQVRKIVMKVRV